MLIFPDLRAVIPPRDEVKNLYPNIYIRSPNDGIVVTLDLTKGNTEKLNYVESTEAFSVTSPLSRLREGRHA